MEPSVNQSDLQALTLVGPPRITPNQNPLAVLHLDNQQGIITSQQIFYSVILTKRHKFPSLVQTIAFLVKSKVWARFLGRDSLAKNVPTRQAYKNILFIKLMVQIFASFWLR